jgi:large subunit ribosomal protein L17
MRHLKSGRKLGRTSDHRRAMYSNLVAALVTHGQIETTEAKAKELRSIADRTIHWGVGVHQLVQKGTKKLSDGERAQVVHAKRMARRVLKNEDALDKLFAQVAPGEKDNDELLLQRLAPFLVAGLKAPPLADTRKLELVSGD